MKKSQKKKLFNKKKTKKIKGGSNYDKEIINELGLNININSLMKKWQLSPNSKMGIEIEVCIHPQFRDQIKSELQKIANKIKNGTENGYGNSYSNWKFITTDCSCPINTNWNNYAKLNQKNIDINLIEDTSNELGTEFSSPILNSKDQIQNYINLFDIFYEKDSNKPLVMTMKKCGIHIHWSNPEFNLLHKNSYEKLFYKFHYMRIFYILEKSLYIELSDRGKYGVNGIYHTNKQLKGVSPIQYFEHNENYLKEFVSNKIYFQYWNSINPDLSFNIFKQFPRNIDELMNVKLYEINFDNKLTVDNFIKYLEISNILDGFSDNLNTIDRFNNFIKQIDMEGIDKNIDEFKKKIFELDYKIILKPNNPIVKFGKFIKKFTYTFSKDEVNSIYKLYYEFLVNKKKENNEIFKDYIKKNNTIYQLIENKGINIDTFLYNFETYFSKNIAYINIEKIQEYILSKYTTYIIDNNKDIDLNNYDIYTNHNKMSYLINTYKIEYEFREVTIQEAEHSKWGGALYNDLHKPMAGKKFIKLYDDEDMHIEYRLFANTELENKEKFKSRLLKLFEICDKISYRIGSAIKSLFNEDYTNIDYLAESFFDDIADANRLFEPGFTKDLEFYHKIIE